MNELNLINQLIKQCEQSELESFAYQDKMFSIHFSKVKAEEDFCGNVFTKKSEDNNSQPRIDNIEIDLDEVAITDTSKIDKKENDDIVTVISSFVGTVEFCNQIKLASDDIYIKEGDVICSIEAMKLYNDIKAPVSGTIVEVLVKDCSLVEYEQPILKIRVDKNE